MLSGEVAGTIVQVQAANYLKASVRIIGWITSDPYELEKMRYNGVIPIKNGKPLIFIEVN